MNENSILKFGKWNGWVIKDLLLEEDFKLKTNKKC